MCSSNSISMCCILIHVNYGCYLADVLQLMKSLYVTASDLSSIRPTRIGSTTVEPLHLYPGGLHRHHYTVIRSNSWHRLGTIFRWSGEQPHRFWEVLKQAVPLLEIRTSNLRFASAPGRLRTDHTGADC